MKSVNEMFEANNVKAKKCDKPKIARNKLLQKEIKAIFLKNVFYIV